VTRAPLADAPSPGRAAAAIPVAEAAPAAAPAGAGQSAGPAQAADAALAPGKAEAVAAGIKTAPALAMIDDDETAAPPASHVGGNRWGIQVGAYAHSAQAHSAALQVKRSIAGLHKATIAVVRSRAGHSTVYRARLTGLTPVQAQAACGNIHRHRGECVIVAPGSEHTLAALAH
ncbi:MAG: hypothetical protein ACHQF3_06910, partial [Alphaproteobacteria bacterium]